VKYAVCKNGIFKSIQGEGYNCGKSAVFIRLAGCNMIPRCQFCDEKFDDSEELEEQEILERVIKFAPFAMVVITGGEPTAQNLTDLVNLLKSNNFYVSIETNGMNKIDYNLDWITCSPKNEKVNIKEVNELKFVVDKSCEEMNLFIDAVSSNVKHDYVYLQPESNKNSMISNCVEMISENSDYRLSLQIHKIIGIE
jgi:radical SAM domain protein